MIFGVVRKFKIKFNLFIYTLRYLEIMSVCREKLFHFTFWS